MARDALVVWLMVIVSRVFAAVLVVLLGVMLAQSGIAFSASDPGTFVDDDGNIHEGNIEAIAAAGVTRGCNPPTNDRYCPDGTVTRGQMAAFVARALNLPASPIDHFLDDDLSVFEADINALAEAGITKGCNPPANDRYCPSGKVTRGQMAAYIRRAFGYPNSSADFFTDDDGSLFEADINAIAGAAVTRGCNPPSNNRYCPEGLVKRDQMASFFARAMNLVSLPPGPTTTSSTSTTSTSTTSTVPPWFVQELVSVSSSEVQGNGQSGADSYWGLAISADGSIVSFASNSTNLVPGIDDGNTRVYVRDVASGTTEHLGLGGCCGMSMSGDGRYIAFQNATLVVLFDRVTDAIVDSWAGRRPVVSADGRYVVNEAPTGEVALTDRVTDTVTTASKDRDGSAVSGSYAGVDSTGRLVVFYTGSPIVVASDTNGADDVFVYDADSATTELVSQSAAGTIGNGDSNNGLISPNGRYVYFRSSASNLDPDDSDSSFDVFVRDRSTGTTTRLIDGDLTPVSVSADNRYVTFNTWPGVPWIYDNATNELIRLDVANDGSFGNNPLGKVIFSYPVVSSNGLVAAFASEADMLVSGDFNDRVDVFVASQPK